MITSLTQAEIPEAPAARVCRVGAAPTWSALARLDEDSGSQQSLSRNYLHAFSAFWGTGGLAFVFFFFFFGSTKK